MLGSVRCSDSGPPPLSADLDSLPFRLIPPRDRKLFRLVKKAEAIPLVKGRVLYGAGDPAREVFLVRTGFMRLVLPAMEPGRPERTVGVALPWELFGDEAFTEGHRRYGAIAGSKCSVLPLSKAGVLHGLKTAKSSLDAYLEGVERELHRLRHAQGGSHGPTAAQRLAEVLLDMGDRCGEPEGRRIELSERLTHQVLADLAGAHRATVTTLLNDWLYEKILGTTSEGCLCLQKPSELWALAGYHEPSQRLGEGDRSR
jgi:CRP/FNR family cyclic AMP-dependent transcriptional regulator